MATSLSTTLSSNNLLHPNTNANLTSTRVLSYQTLKPHPNKTFSLSTRRCHLVPSAVSGSPGIETSEVSEDSSTLLDTVKVFDLNGNGIPISQLWKDRKAVVAFARHFGCVFCRKRADYLASKKVRTKEAMFLPLSVLIGKRKHLN
nr:thioredoxin-like protein aaed1, chloroplastic [Quercus suber]